MVSNGSCYHGIYTDGNGPFFVRLEGTMARGLQSIYNEIPSLLPKWQDAMPSKNLAINCPQLCDRSFLHFPSWFQLWIWSFFAVIILASEKTLYNTLLLCPQRSKLARLAITHVCLTTNAKLSKTMIQVPMGCSIIYGYKDMISYIET